MFVPDRLKTNAFRVLGLPANATLSEIHKAAGTMRRAASLGLVHTTEADMATLGELSRTESDIQTANPTGKRRNRSATLARTLQARLVLARDI